MTASTPRDRRRAAKAGQAADPWLLIRRKGLAQRTRRRRGGRRWSFAPSRAVLAASALDPSLVDPLGRLQAGRLAPQYRDGITLAAERSQARQGASHE